MLWAGVLCVPTAVSFAQTSTGRPQPRERVVVIDSVHVIDVAAKQVIANQRIVVRGEHIVSVQPAGGALPDTVDERVSAAGAYAIPGLVDHHVHLSPGMSSALARAAKGGVTLVQAMAGDNRTAGEYARMVIAKQLAGPEIAYASVMAGPGFFADPRFRNAGLGFAPGMAPWAKAVTDTTNVVLAVAAARGSGAEVLKLYAMMDSALVAKLTREAHAQGMRVVAHGTVFPARPLQLVGAGVDILTHAPYLSWQGAASVRADDAWNRAKGPYEAVPVNAPPITAVVEAMKNAGTFLEPTLFVFSRQTAETEMNTWAASLTAQAFSNGVPILAGTDGLIDGDSSALPNVHRELQLLVAAGLPPADALASATIIPARAMGRSRSHGVLAAGYMADMVLLNGNPLLDISATTRIRTVLLRGRVLPP